jgi:hypothetical protein
MKYEAELKAFFSKHGGSAKTMDIMEEFEAIIDELEENGDDFMDYVGEIAKYEFFRMFKI